MLIAATTTPRASRVRNSGSPLSRAPSTARMMPRIDGATRERSSGTAQTGTGPRGGCEPRRRRSGSRRSISSSASGSARLATTAKSSARPCASSVSARSAIWPISAGVRGVDEPSCSPLPCASAQDEQHRCAEVRCDARVVRELCRAADVGVVAAEDDDGVALRLDRLVALHDRRERGLGVGPHIVVGDAHAFLVGEVDAIVGEQHLEHVVALGRGPGDGPEDAHPGGRVAQGVEHPEGDGGLAGVPFGGRDEDALRHSLSLRASRVAGPIARDWPPSAAATHARG